MIKNGFLDTFKFRTLHILNLCSQYGANNYYRYFVDLWLLSDFKLLIAAAVMDTDEECSVVIELSENDPFFDKKKVKDR